ncbi:MAG: low molecular weight phosphotyrosine protein phosphatase, partial [Clostridia bacterium]|nr:low molecular weight phosphotyrosine protein phosphatase [Clostridia bacterium]
NLFDGDKDGKVRLLRSFIEEEKEIADPYYSGDFDTAYREIEDGVKMLIRYLNGNG